MIPVISFKKNNKDIDEFNVADCVICMDPFENGTKVRKIPTCRHILHDECLIKWFEGPSQAEQQRCPMCNEEVTIEALKQAIED